MRDNVSFLLGKANSVEDSCSRVWIQLNNMEGVHVFGCHLSNRPGGTIGVGSAADKLAKYIKRLPIHENCKSNVTMIQIVTGLR